MDVRGIEIHVATDGPTDGPPVVLLHAFPLNQAMWNGVVPALVGAGWRVIRPDFRGFGRSEVPPGPYLMEELAVETLHVLDALGVGRACICGLSMGGYVLLEMLSRAPERFAGAGLFSTRASADTDEAKQNRRATAARLFGDPEAHVRFVDGLMAMLLGETTRRERPDAVATARRLGLSTSRDAIAAAQLGMAERVDHTATLATLIEHNIPTLFIAGDEDPLTGPDVARQMSEQVPEATVVILPGAGHLPPLETPEAFARALTTFLETLPGTD